MAHNPQHAYICAALFWTEPCVVRMLQGTPSRQGYCAKNANDDMANLLSGPPKPLKRETPYFRKM
eukprot:5293702-Amphidinium_carterae.1